MQICIVLSELYFAVLTQEEKRKTKQCESKHMKTQK
jgi:hypothetical protein